jgi:hypothetical protein
LQRVYDDDDAESSKKGDEGKPAESAVSAAQATEAEILSKFQDAFKVGLCALEYFSVAQAEKDSKDEDEDDDDDEGTPAPTSKVLVVQPAKYVRAACVNCSVVLVS